jgi:DNA-binding IclR family transcriptional regulator
MDGMSVIKTAETEGVQDQNGDAGLVPALTRGCAILDFLAKHPGADFTAIHSALSLPKSSTHNLLAALGQLGLIGPQGARGYVLGLKLAELGNIAAGQRFSAAEFTPLLRRLADELQLTCHLGVLEGREAVYLSKVECDHPIKVDSWIGKRFSLHCSALGKVLLAWLPEAELTRALVDISWTANTRTTITDPERMRAHLTLVRQRGWATDDEENVPDIRCVAAPVFDREQHVAAAISAVGTILQVSTERFEALAPRLQAAAQEISRSAFGAR